jgi:hypothetical protein
MGLEYSGLESVSPHRFPSLEGLASMEYPAGLKNVQEICSPAGTPPAGPFLTYGIGFINGTFAL